MGFKVGDKVRIIGRRVGHGFKIGEEVEVVSVHLNGTMQASNGRTKWFVIGEEIELIKRKNTYYEDCLTLIANLSAEVARLTKRVEALEGRTHLVGGIEMRAFDMHKRKPTREEIVERAKADIEALKRNGMYDIEDTDLPSILRRCNVEFIVNREKRTVVALLRGYESGNVYAKGIAKCAPDDCFNSHVGKAIALRRALGVEVPQEYPNAPAPEGVEVGDVVSLLNVGGEVVVDNQWKKNELTRQVWGGDAKVIDDSDREVYAND